MTLDRGQRLRTVLAFVVLVAVLGLNAVQIACIGGPVPSIVLYGLPVFLLVTLGIAWAMAPTALVVNGAELKIERRAWRPFTIPLASIESTGRLDGSDPWFRVMGVGGFFGSYGTFYSSNVGRFRLYATRTGQAVIVRRKTGSPVVATPDDVAGTIAALDAVA